MIERFLLIITIIIGVFVIIKYMKYRQLKKIKSTLHELADDKETEPYIVYFWSTQCQQCQNVQQPILNSISQKFGYSIKKVNISENDDIIRQWNVRTVPSTYILNKFGEVEFINNGFKSEKEIISQLETL
jgi:thioredoxin-like negative regulator of GroEL